MASQNTKASLFHFIPFQTNHNAEEHENKDSRRRARSHAIKQGILSKYKSQKTRLENFRHYKSLYSNSVPTIEPPSRVTLRADAIKITRFPDEMQWDPFDSLPVSSSRLHALLDLPTSRQAVEPVFSLAGPSPFHNYHSLLQMGLDDIALSNAFVLSLAIAAGYSHSTTENLTYKSDSLRGVSDRLQDPQTAIEPTTIGAILLLIGAECRIGDLLSVQTHLRGLQQLLSVCMQQHKVLSHEIKRAIFWQDLNSAILVGSQRVFDHTTFPELNWQRDKHLQSLYVAPPGFREHADYLGREYMRLAEDIRALQLLCDSELLTRNANDLERLDNQQAWIESRLYWSWRSAVERGDGLDSCVLCAYICTYILHTEIWEGSAIPSHCSMRLLNSLQEKDETRWTGYEELHLWVVFIGGSFTSSDVARNQYAKMLGALCRKYLDTDSRSWTALRVILKRFIWSERTIMPACYVFWEQCAALLDT